MKYICKDCESTFDESEIAYQREYMGEFWGTPAYEELAVCPYCSSDEIEEISIF